MPRPRLAEAAALQVRLEREEFDQQAAAVRAQQRAARDPQLGTVRTVDEAEQPVATVTRRSTDAPLGALAFFLVRLAVGGWAGIVGWQALVDQQATVDALLKVGIPQEYTSWLGWGTGIGLLVIAFVLIGLGTRIFAAHARRRGRLPGASGSAVQSVPGGPLGSMATVTSSWQCSACC